MPTYSTWERQFARFFNSTPLLKGLLKRGYVFLNYCIYSINKSRLFSVYDIYCINDCLPSNGQKNELFFGYYDKYPMNNSGLMLLNMTSYSTKKNPSARYPISVFLINMKQRKVLLEIKTGAYNWQQGCRVHWLNDELFILNDFNEKNQKYVARVFSVPNLREVKRFDYPVQDSFGTDYFLSINYRRIDTLRPDYGYRNLPKMSDTELKRLDDDGIWKIDYETGESKLLYSLKQIAAFGVKQINKDVYHKVNHLMINTSGDKFIFIHRYLKKNVRFDRLLLADVQGNLLKVLADNGMVSHCCWLNENTVFAYLRGIDDIDAYYSIDIHTGKMTLFDNTLFRKYGDGHPSSNGRFILSDSYPDKALHQHLFLYDIESGESKELGSFFHGLSYNEETRCDLHPRLSPDAKRVFFDSVCHGKRQLYYMDL